MGAQALKSSAGLAGVPEPGVPLGVGVCLEATEASLAEWNGTSATGQARILARDQGTIPPSALLPRFAGEPIRADIAWPSHPRGSGEVWPPEAIVSAEFGSGRFPLAYAWSMLDQDASRQPDVWPWSHGVGGNATPADAIAAVFSAIHNADGPRGTPGPPVLVVPNDLRESAQRELIDSAARLGSDIRLLWRPVAAALTWCDHHRATFDDSSPSDSIVGTLLSLHLGIDRFEATTLQIRSTRHDGEVFLVPARSRPGTARSIGSMTSPWFQLFHRMAGSLVKAGTRIDERVWQLLWATPWLSHVLTLGRSKPRHGELPRFSGEEWDPKRIEEARSRSLVLVGSGSRPPGRFLFPPAFSASPHFLGEWFRKVRASLTTEALLGAIITGPLAADLTPGGSTYGLEQLHSLWPNARRVLVEGTDLPSGMLAAGAALYAARVASGLPTYLDTLPRLRTVVRRDGEPRWEPLLQEEDQYAEGGKLWRREPNLDGLAIPKHNSSIDIVLDHGEYSTVRQVSVPLGCEFDRATPITLAVSIEPAQGGAKIQVVPRESTLLGHRRVFVEWRGMLDVGVDPQQYIDNLPRTFPILAERESSWARWVPVKNCLNRFLNANKGGRDALLVEAIAALRQKDQDMMPRDATAVSSDGVPPDVPDVLDRFIESLAPALASSPSRAGALPVDKVVRALGYTSSPDSRIRHYITARLKSRGADLEDYDLVACGLCLRDPTTIALFARAFLDRIRTRSTGNNDWLKAMGCVLRYRATATREISTPDCEEITRYALSVFERELAAFNAQYSFRNACLIIVYLLRRRAFEDTYLDPTSHLARKAKSAFMRALQAMDRGQIERQHGVVDLDSALKGMIEYIDRKGHGNFLLGI